MIINKRIPLKYWFSLIKYQLPFIVVISAGLSYADQFIEPVLGLKFPLMPMTIPSILGTLITLVLAFKMAQSYDRWWEARKIWGEIVNDSRAFIREVSFLMTEDSSANHALRDVMITNLIGWCYALAYSLRGITGTSHNPYLSPSQQEELDKIDHNTPNAMLYQMMSNVKIAYDKGYVTDYQQIRLASTINDISVAMGKSERIKHTVFPKLYTKAIDISIWAFMVIFPLAFRDNNEYIEFPIVTAVCSMFFMLANLAKDLKDPFENRPTDISMLAIVRNIEIFGLKVMNKKDIPAPLEAEKFYIM
ncbi:hypothetical protein BFP72_10375 [Reichenbachiella sp. 5M10]|uniref:bestrophin family protein n=1 Tax=Reichenbachiella sp. 5M10 TaxID=1889772 RepID=UPI000C15A364|nr:bestrophin family ion channel [Reichenbachiella sp. 5M10]PIB35769.1 hypothetical protein BFP72_10375 [Reichenbachiella sp. 5M10]